MKKIKPASVIDKKEAPQGVLTEEAAMRIRKMAKRMAAASLLFALACTPAHAVVRTLQVTLTSSNTAILSAGAHLNTRWFVIQNNAAHACRIGDVNISSSRGILLATGVPGGSFYVAPDPSGSGRDLGGWYINGTSGDVIDVIYDDGA